MRLKCNRQIGILKNIFEYVLKDSNLLAEETMLIDDASVNCRAAELLGMKSYMPQQREDWSHLFK